MVVTDGYQVYHTLENQREDLQIAGCWVHAKRKFAEIVKTTDSEALTPDDIVAGEATKRIAKMFHLDNELDNLSKTDKEKQRELTIKPLVDDFFAWAKSVINKLPAGGTSYKGLQYCLNQEKYLRVFLSNGNVPMDNNVQSRQSVLLPLVERTGSMFTPRAEHPPVPFFTVLSKQQEPIIFESTIIWSMSSPNW